jgi:menaquinol-cytochrome c reductase iron-sulfur subunit
MYGFLAAVGAGLGITALPYLLMPPKRPGQEGWVDAGDLSELVPGSPRKLTFVRRRVDGWNMSAGQASAWVIRQPGGGITAFSPVCTHLGCAYHWESAQKEFLCPCHGSRFATDGKVLSGPAPRPLDQYEVKVAGARVWLGPVETPGAARS